MSRIHKVVFDELIVMVYLDKAGHLVFHVSLIWTVIEEMKIM